MASRRGIELFRTSTPPTGNASRAGTIAGGAGAVGLTDI